MIRENISTYVEYFRSYRVTYPFYEIRTALEIKEIVLQNTTENSLLENKEKNKEHSQIDLFFRHL